MGAGVGQTMAEGRMPTSSTIHIVAKRRVLCKLAKSPACVSEQLLFGVCPAISPTRRTKPKGTRCLSNFAPES